MSRIEARELAFKVLYEIEMQSDWKNPDFDKYLNDYNLGEQDIYVKTLLINISNNIEKIDQLINNNSTGWPIKRIAKIDLSILRLAIGDMLFIDDAPDKVAINEAIELAKRYSTENSPKFINAVLGKIKG